MGYTTTFNGQISIEPPLSPMEVKYINEFNESRRMDRTKGPYFVDGSDGFGQGHDADIIDYNKPPEGQPGLWCQWCATEDGKYIEWDEGEKFYSAAKWMQYIIDHFLAHEPIAAKELPFLEGHTLNGVIDAEGEESGDIWRLSVENNTVTTLTGVFIYE